MEHLTTKTVDTNDWSYSYDADDQLTEEEAPTFIASYSYDANGNRASYTVGGVTQTYNVDDGDKLTSITSGGVTLKSYTYDSAGRTTAVTTSAGTTSLSYDYEDRITGITYPSTATNSFSYNGLDTRVGKTDSSGTYGYVRDGADVTAPVLDDGAANYTPGVSQHRSGATTFENEDYLGTSTRQTNSSETTTATRSYDAFGNLVSTTGTPIGPFGFVGKAGYQEDGDSGLKLLGHRYYDPSTGRFLTRDRAKDGRSWYSYCAGRCLVRVDPSGDWLLQINFGIQIILPGWSGGLSIDWGFGTGGMSMGASVSGGKGVGLGIGGAITGTLDTSQSANTYGYQESNSTVTGVAIPGCPVSVASVQPVGGGSSLLQIGLGGGPGGGVFSVLDRSSETGL